MDNDTQPTEQNGCFVQSPLYHVEENRSRESLMPDYEPLEKDQNHGFFLKSRSPRSIAEDASHGVANFAVEERRREHIVLVIAVLVVWLADLSPLLYLDVLVTDRSQSIFGACFGIVLHLFDHHADPDLDEILWHWGFSSSHRTVLRSNICNATLNIDTMPMHSHNDYWRKHPLFDAIKYGAVSVEADVYVRNITVNKRLQEDLLVGHKPKDLRTDKTLTSMYLNPLYQILTYQNSPETLQCREGKSTDGFQGVYDTAPDKSFVLLIDVKTNGTSTLPIVLRQLQALRDKDWLTYYDSSASQVISRPLTVVMSGNTVFEDLLALPEAAYGMKFRDVFFDAPLDKLEDPDHGKPQGQFFYNSTNSQYASVAFGRSVRKSGIGRLSSFQSAKVETQVNAAKARGLISRYYDTPGWPAGVRNAVWQSLVDDGEGILSVDHLTAANKFLSARNHR
ncbi:MAG: hypothetical protein Q9227_003618 [Pyrenula ochraceoflavens]